jgi:preprotein translocase subunit SecE
MIKYSTVIQMKKPEISIAKPAISKIGPIQFIKQSVTELKKVTWPTRQDTVKLTLIVLAVSTVVGLYIGALDYLYTKIIEYLI